MSERKVTAESLRRTSLERRSNKETDYIASKILTQCKERSEDGYDYLSVDITGQYKKVVSVVILHLRVAGFKAYVDNNYLVVDWA